MFSCYVLDSSRFPGQGYSLQSASHKSSVFSYKIWTQSVQQVPGFSSVSYGILAQALSFLFHLLLHKAKGFSLQLASNRSSIKIWTQVYSRFLALAFSLLASWLRLFPFCSTCYFIRPRVFPPTGLKQILSFQFQNLPKRVKKVPDNPYFGWF